VKGDGKKLDRSISYRYFP